MIRKRILLASLLKPVSDTRLYEKIGQSLVKLPEFDVHIAGFQSKAPAASQSQRITAHPIFNFKRMSVQRFTAQVKFWRLLKELKPDLLLVATHELLPIGWWYCKQHNCKLVYDVQENYFLNLTTQKVYPGILGKAFGFGVRLLEKLLAPGVDHFFLAEKSYAQELPFLDNRYTVLQNKYLPPAACETPKRSLPVSLKEVQPLRLLFSGTISRLYGVLEAIEFTKQLRAWVPDAELIIIGYCADAAFLQELTSRIQELPFVQWIGGAHLVPHEEILTQEQVHHIGLLPYHPHPSTFNCIPTKLFEYMGNGLVVITQENPLWEEILKQTNAGFSHRFSENLTKNKVEVLLNSTYYHRGIPSEVFWQEEEQQTQVILKGLLKI
ncbi:glycosyltransferase family protein [Rufibacter latericius]|uniref:Glycosyltransferase n=1 Tax=Rufibacter latericius TaxID=2487040 RepID=A0A3M9MNS8_9BACT|nr:glycosyltransferase [Rufibacter latericius]RNI26503.1 glycosyltransferase [Rufibacter latericius]